MKADTGALDKISFPKVRSWALVSIINLAVVSVLGVLLRFKIAWSLPVLNYKYLLNAHSHFAFNGWVTTVIFTAFLYVLASADRPLPKVYTYLFWFNQLSGYGMLASFIWQGYGAVSIFFSALSVLFSYWFAYRFGRDISRTELPWLVKTCMRAGLFFLVLSSSGPLLLSYSLSHSLGGINFYQNAVYLYLHFQYNGWFTFAVAGLFFYSADRFGISLPENGSRWFVWLMAIACIPAYAMSLLWTDPAAWIWMVALSAGVMQLVSLIIFSVLLWRGRRNPDKRPQGPAASNSPSRILLGMSFFAFGIKVILQGLSVIPFFGRLAFGFRPVIIAYLHLVMLCFVSFFILGFMIREGILRTGRPLLRIGIWTWIAGVIANEVILLAQSLLALEGDGWEGSPYFLFGAALIILTGISIFLAGQYGTKRLIN